MLCINNYMTQDGLFDGLVHLEQLVLYQNEIDTIGLRVLSSRQGLPHLKGINLSYNRLKSLEPWPMIRAQASPGLTVTVANNKISTFTNHANWTYTCSDKALDLTLNLDFNQMSHVYAFFGEFFTRSIQILCFYRKPMHLMMNGNPLVCDCLDFDMYQVFSAFTKSSGIAEFNRCENIMSYITNTRITTVPLDQLVCDVT